MGIDAHGLQFLRYAKTFGNFDKTIMVGRQEIYARESFVREAVAAGSDYRNEKYCERLLLNYFGSSGVDSIDHSSFDGATFVHDMNLPLPSNLQACYDTVIDGGSLEHIFNIPQALKNCSQFCKAGGQILHILPANNFCGHGFWQFSPELFFSLYSNRNGYENTEVFLADLSDTTRWFKVKRPEDGRRVNVFSSSELYVLVRTVVKEASFSHSDVQQSDYVFKWTESGARIEASKPLVRPNGMKQVLKKSPLAPLLAWRRELIGKRMIRREVLASQLNGRNPGLTEMTIKSLL